ncbi:hypothetical protein J8281_04540 [Aquimarina sp. U1-2]|uniref:hypothetical protein n=1 Tax=Aquimarina sp. U1-2 TaxID=2823141 RepID=UPI001AECB48B|nr:hypothetical protein [Aquimarina sp. U1-2]MBP2831449.1 hypothetical protein [Aquimarina sp. U1-2]
MKNNIYKITCCLFLCALFLACDRNDDEDFGPVEYRVPTIDLGRTDAQLGVGQFINLTIEIRTFTTLKSIQVVEGSNVIQDVSFDGNEGNLDFTFLYRVPADWLDTMRDLTFTVTDRLNQKATATFQVSVSEIVPQYTIEDVTIDGQDYKEITGIVNLDETLTNDNLYILNGEVAVEQSTTLTIEEGTTIYGVDETSRLRVRQFGTIAAEGTTEEPIVFTSFETAPGQSGNAAPGSWSGVQIEGSGPVDNSGVFKYVRIEYAGGGDDAFQLSSVGAQTTVEYVQVYRSVDNAFRINGGGVNLKYIIATDCEDASIRYDDNNDAGWEGNGQFWIINTTFTGNAVEGRDDASAFISNVTITGSGFNDASSAPGGFGFLIRNNATARVYNAIVTGVETSIRYRNGSEDFLRTPSVFSNSTCFGNDEDADDPGFHSSAEIFDPTDSSYDPIFNNSVVPFAITNSYIGVSTANSTDPSLIDSFFESANYVGAVQEGNDWTVGWTRNIDGTIRE